MTYDDKIEELKIKLPEAKPPVGNYVATKIVSKMLFVSGQISIDEKGVGELVKMGVEGGRKTRFDIKLGICGEHGGDPKSIHFCERVSLDYVSCSPFRVPIARLAAAQAALANKD